MLRIHLLHIPRARTPVRQPGPGLVRDEVREEVSQNSEQRQTRDAVRRQNPRSTAFMFPDGRGGRRGLVINRRRNDRGPIFHAKTSSGKIVAQVRYASRLPRVMARQDYLGRILPRIHAVGRENCDWNHSINMQIYFHNRNMPRRSAFRLALESNSATVLRTVNQLLDPLSILPCTSGLHGIMTRVPFSTYA